ncbi:hypothetical protein EXW96_22830 [Paenibacillus sp. JMULE4]|uniref:hypothetical protein n=1 Tax=Paenibacillus sp. JMULE4 TaxID=2518342 RepID=UPI001576A32B|nr:hypothetical protein [Paenibacillus sp. JMULE4]NTZ20273.1 hypothetical protein [Paenibacillus sp. JMULE4]
MEATSNAFWIHAILSDYPGQVVVANPLKTHAIAEARVKTDALEAQILAQLLAADFIPESWVPNKEEYLTEVFREGYAAGNGTNRFMFITEVIGFCPTRNERIRSRLVCKGQEKP